MKLQNLHYLWCEFKKEGSAGYALAYILSTVVLGLSATYVADLLVK